MRRIYLQIAVAAALAIAWGLPGVAQATFPGKNGKLAYNAVYPASPLTINLINPDGSGRTKLTNDPPIAQGPAWSPDGTRVAFIGRATFEEPGDIYVVNGDGTGLTRLTNDEIPKGDPCWSPDGRKIAFTEGAPAEIHVMNADGSGQVNITNSPTTEERAPDWSPDGTKIAFTGSPLFSGKSDVWTMNPDGGDKTRLTNSEFTKTDHDSGPSWSPDGKRIAFEHVFSDYPNTPHEDLSFIYVMNADGGGRTNFGPSGSNLVSPPAWSPDGQKIAFEEYFKRFHVINADGTGGDFYVDDGAFYVDSPDWQPIPGPKRNDYKNAAQFCKAERADLGSAAFARKYGSKGPKKNTANAYGKCVSESH